MAAIKYRQLYYPSYYLCLILSVFIGVSCNEHKQANQLKASVESISKKNKVSKLTSQAILKVQPFEYDSTDINKVTSKYVNKNSLNVPQFLASQNKWIMFEGPVLENDKIAYRYYADSRHRFDIYGKKVNDLVMDTVSWKYHDIMDWGSDILKVGNSLGIGSPSIYYKNKVYPFINWESKEIEVIASGGETSTIKTTFTGLQIEDKKVNVTETWSLSVGDIHSEIELKSENALPDGMKFATGIVKHLDKAIVDRSGHLVLLSTWGIQSFHNQNLGMSIICEKISLPRVEKDDDNHLMIFDQSDGPVTYYFLADWSESLMGSKTQLEFISKLTTVQEKIQVRNTSH